MGQMVRFQETLRRLTMIDEGFIEGQAGLGLGLDGAPALDEAFVNHRQPSQCLLESDRLAHMPPLAVEHYPPSTLALAGRIAPEV